MTDAAETPLAELARLRRRVRELEAEVTTLRDSEAEQRAMFSAMTDAVLIVDRDGRYLRVPETASEARHKPDPRLLGKTMHDALPAAEADAFVAGIRRVLAERRMLNNVYSRTIAGEELWFSANASPLGADTVLLVVREITDDVRHEQALRDNLRQQERLREHEAALLRLSTPLIPIGDDILVMPLIGRLDAALLEHAQDTLLNGIAAARARGDRRRHRRRRARRGRRRGPAEGRPGPPAARRASCSPASAPASPRRWHRPPPRGPTSPSAPV
ncbi:PAS domain-containing protein [Nannocystis pusilla]|uniref:PAS domain-containing protein n=1 Tax=Nannocystis pusilla TaxID=889268 RepID=A0A9X3J3A9_9BACT|nr:PAS domain-containing protein [Nannocystis pusilla]MCY1013571.1 PAS domain-containing protein [Nannocystis pusilla]